MKSGQSQGGLSLYKFEQVKLIVRSRKKSQHT